MINRKYRRKRNVLFKKGIPMLSVEDVSKVYGFHPNTIRAWVNRDCLRHVRHGPGRKFFFRQDDVEKFTKIWYSDHSEGVEQ